MKIDPSTTALKERVRELEDKITMYEGNLFPFLKQKCEALEAQLAAAQADARRYRWLRDKAYGDEWNDAHSSDDLDAFVDAALASPSGDG